MLVNSNNELCIYDKVSSEKVCLTPKEWDVFSCLMAKNSNKKIAILFECSHRTVEVHVSKILSKFSLNSREEVYERINICDEYEDLKDHYEKLIGKSAPLDELKEKPDNIVTFFKKVFLFCKKYKFQYIATGVILLLVTIAVNHKLSFLTYGQSIATIRPDLPTPPSSIFIERENISDEIYNFYEKYDGLPIIALLGVAGSGKTVLARLFSQKAKSQIVWEINAESEETIVNSFEDLAYVLSRTEEEINEVLSLKKIEIRYKKHKLLSFIKRKLDEAENWIIIYDNLVDISSLGFFSLHSHHLKGREFS